MIAVRVKYSPSTVGGVRGFGYVVLLASGPLTWLGEGWSAGSKRCAVESFRAQAREQGWIERSMRNDAMKGAA